MSGVLKPYYTSLFQIWFCKRAMDEVFEERVLLEHQLKDALENLMRSFGYFDFDLPDPEPFLLSDEKGILDWINQTLYIIDLLTEGKKTLLRDVKNKSQLQQVCVELYERAQKPAPKKYKLPEEIDGFEDALAYLKKVSQT
jgi:hypothetical protein